MRSSGFSVDQAVTQVLDQLTAEGANSSAPLAPVVAQREEEKKDKRSPQQLLANLDQLSDEEVGSLLNDMLADEKVVIDR